ncbi:MAG: NAD(P)/FAD-dependent oxidoreductase [Nitrospinota bacterium]|nr:NAD(P)/FAD-dependent oxidoreductase [Nitrospinota bacterium]
MLINDGDTVCVVGGGPGGSACAMVLLQEARQLGRKIRVVLIEHKKFSENRHYNQCIGVLSPPFEDILKNELDLTLPENLVLNDMEGYCLHSDLLSLDLIGEESGRSVSVTRSKFDAFMLEEAQKAGAQVVHNRVTSIEVNHDGVLVYSEGDNFKCAVVVGAFGLDDGTCRIFEQGTPYRQPDFLNTVITRLYPGEEFIQSMGSTIHAFLLSHPGLEFGAVTPKGEHISINIAGRKVSSHIMMEFLRSVPVQRFLPPHKRREKPLNYFKGKFPIAPARNLFGDRYVTIGDAAGLMRPFKGKGINSAINTGIYSARSIMRHGVSKQAFAENFYQDCSVLTEDLPFGRGVRILTNLATRFKFMDHMIAVAAERPDFMKAMFGSVSGHDPYKKIIMETASMSLAFTFAQKILGHFVLRQEAHLPAKSASPTA